MQRPFRTSAIGHALSDLLEQDLHDLGQVVLNQKRDGKGITQPGIVVKQAVEFLLCSVTVIQRIGPLRSTDVGKKI